jgi:hypothetical protein
MATLRRELAFSAEWTVRSRRVRRAAGEQFERFEQTQVAGAA